MMLLKFRKTALHLGLLGLVIGLLTFLFSFFNGYLLAHPDGVFGTAFLSSSLALFALSLGYFSLMIYYEKRMSTFAFLSLSQALMDACHHVLAVLPGMSIRPSSGELAKSFSYYDLGLKQRLAAYAETWVALIGLMALIVFSGWMAPNFIAPLVLFIFLSILCKSFVVYFQSRILENQIETQTFFSAWLNNIMQHIHKIRQADALPPVFKQCFALLAKIKHQSRQLLCVQLFQCATDTFILLVITLLLYAKQDLTMLPLLLMLTPLMPLLDRLSAGVMQGLQARAALKRIGCLLDQPLPPTAGKIKTIPDHLHIVLENLGYQHPGTSKALFNAVQLEWQSGEFIAVIGGSGSGKSTLLRLLLGLLTPTQGRILINGIDLKHYDMKAWRRSLGVVMQNSQLFHASIFANIIGDSSLDLEAAWRLAEEVGIASDIRAMPMGMFTRVSDQAGASLSGGQRQKVLIARALARNPKLLILDEATSALDNISQARIQDCLTERGLTRLVVAHRLSTIAGAGKVYRI